MVSLNIIAFYFHIFMYLLYIITGTNSITQNQYRKDFITQIKTKFTRKMCFTGFVCFPRYQRIQKFVAHMCLQNFTYSFCSCFSCYKLNGHKPFLNHLFIFSKSLFDQFWYGIFKDSAQGNTTFLRNCTLHLRCNIKLHCVITCIMIVDNNTTSFETIQPQRQRRHKTSMSQQSYLKNTVHKQKKDIAI